LPKGVDILVWLARGWFGGRQGRQIAIFNRHYERRLGQRPAAVKFSGKNADLFLVVMLILIGIAAVYVVYS
jgi:hypothetical protein